MKIIHTQESAWAEYETRKQSAGPEAWLYNLSAIRLEDSKLPGLCLRAGAIRNENPVPGHLMMGMGSEKCVRRRFCGDGNLTAGTHPHLDGAAHTHPGCVGMPCGS